MKKLLFISLILFFSCDNEDSPDCFKSTGDQVTKIVETTSFTSLLINNEFNVLLTEGPITTVQLTTGENIFSDIIFLVDGDLLEVTNTVSCKWVREYDYPTLEITHPNLESLEIIGGSIIESNGILTYPNLSFKSKSSNGTITLNIQSESLSIDNNEITNYFVTGAVTNLNIVYSSGDGRFEGQNLRVTNATIQQQSSNDIIVNVRNELRGSINSTGNLIYVGELPALIDVTINDRGKLIDGTD